MKNKTFHSLISPELTPLQKEQTELGKDHDLSDEEIALYCSSRYNFSQMRQIRLALEHHADRRKLFWMLNPSLEAEVMEERRRRIEQGNGPSFLPSALMKGLRLSGMLCALAAVLYICVPEEKAMALDLGTDHIILEYGQEFDPAGYIAEYKPQDAEIILPEEIDTRLPGSRVLTYRIVKDGAVLEKHVLLTVRKEDSG